MKALVTGGTGFIGRRLVRQLVAHYGVDAVACLVKPPVTPLEAEALETFRGQGLRLIEGDLMARPVAAQAPPAVDVVFHLAANIDTDAPLEALRVNHEGTDRLLDWLSVVSRGTRIVYASSVAVHDRDGRAGGTDCRNQSADSPDRLRTDKAAGRRNPGRTRHSRWLLVDRGPAAHGLRARTETRTACSISSSNGRRAARCSAASTGRGARASSTWTMWRRR